MSDMDPILKLAQEVGNLSGVISEQSKTLREIKLDMKERITENDCKVIVDDAIDKHREQDHSRKTSISPGVSVKINAAMLKKIGLIVGGTAIGSSGVWAIVRQVLDYVQ